MAINRALRAVYDLLGRVVQRNDDHTSLRKNTGRGLETRLIASFLAIALIGFSTIECFAAATPDKAVEIPREMANAGILVEGKVTSVVNVGPNFFENTYSYVTLELTCAYRGSLPLDAPLIFSVKGWLESQLPTARRFTEAQDNGQCVIVALERVYNPFLREFETLDLLHIFPCTLETKTQAEVAGKLPIGWTCDGEKVASAWDVSLETWGDSAEPHHGFACHQSGRPAFLTNPEVELKVERTRSLPSKDESPAIIEYRIIVANPTDHDIAVESLRSLRGEILWDESILFLNHDEIWLPRGFTKLSRDTEPTIIAARESVQVTMLFSAQFDFRTQICLGNLGFSIYENQGWLYDYVMEHELHPRPPMQKQP